jgi:hypothetical protein
MGIKYIKVVNAVAPLDMQNDTLLLEGNGNIYTIQTYGAGTIIVYGSLFPIENNVWTTVVTLTSTATEADSAVFQATWVNYKVVADTGVQFRIQEHV